jgi:nucleotide-binding universal stress UspA family protein
MQQHSEAGSVFHKILVPIDGSPNSYRGLQYAIDIAKKYDAEVTLIHVIEPPSVVFPEVPIPQSYFTRMDEFTKGLFARRKQELESKGLKVKTLLVRGNATQQILKASKGFDLIVMGSKGYGTFRTFWLGSVASGVLNHSSVPVLVVRPE